MPLKLVPQRDHKLHSLLQNADDVVAPRGRSLFEMGEPARALFLVREGHVRLTLPQGDRSGERTVAVAGPWEIFGEEALVSGSLRSYGARAGERVRIQAVDGEEAYRAIRTTGHILPLLLKAASTDLLRARWPAPGASGPTTAQRLADLLLELVCRFGQQDGDCEEEVRIPHWFTHAELADLVGAHRSTVTTQLNEWIYEGLLQEASGELVVARRNGLRERSSRREDWLENPESGWDASAVDPILRPD